MGSFFLLMSLIYSPTCAGILVVLSDKFFKDDFKIEEIANEIAGDEEAKNYS